MNFIPLNSLIDPDQAPFDGVLFAWLIEQAGTGQEIPPDQVLEKISNPAQRIWLHLNFSNARILPWLERLQLIPPELADSIQSDTMDAGDDAITEYPQGTLFHLKDFTHEFRQDPKGNNLDFESFWCFLTPRLLITGRLHPLRTFDQVKEQLLRGQIAPETLQGLFHQILDIRSIQLKATIRRLADRIDSLEEIILNGLDLSPDESIGALRIQCNRIRRHFSAEHDALKYLQKRSTPLFQHEELEQLREHTTELTSFLGQIDSLYIRAKVLQDEQSAHVAELNAKQLQVLSVMTVIFLPMTLISGIMGMNMEDLPGLKGSFTTVMVLMGLTGLIVYFGLRIKRIM
jgi:zinc transporter